MASAVSSAEAGKSELIWPTFKPSKPDLFPGKKEMTPEQTLIEFISTSAGLHGVQKQSLRSLEWDLLKVFPYNIMPANAAAWYMAKRKFYADQPPDQQLLPFILKKYPNKFAVRKFQVEFLENYSKETAKRKLTYLVQYGIDAYFSHKVDEYGVYFFDPNYYERTEPFHESLRICTRGAKSKSRLVTTYFSEMKKSFSYKAHTNSLSTLTKDPSTKILTNTTCVIVSMVNNQYGFLKFGNGDKALFCAKALFRDGWQYTGDPLRLPAMHFDGYQVPEGTKRGGEKCKWVAVLVWCGRKPAPKYYSTLADFNLTKEGLMETQCNVSEGRRLRQPSSSMMIGQVISIRKNGAVISVRDGCPEQVFVPGWSKENASKPGVWLTTLSGETIGLRDLVAYYIDNEEAVPGFAAVGKNVIVLKEHEEVESKKKRRNRASVSMSEGAYYEPRRSESEMSERSYSESEGDAVSDGELEWLENDLDKIMEKDGPEANTRTLFLSLKKNLAEARANSGMKKTGQRERRDSGVGSNPTTPRENGPLKVGRRSADAKNFWRTKAALASIDEDYRSSDDEDYESGDEISSIEVTSRTRRQSATSSASNTSKGRQKKKRAISSSESETVEKDLLPYWVRALSYPEEYDETTGKFLPVDKWYVEEKDPDYYPPLTDDDDEEEDEETSESEAKEDEAEKVEEKSKSKKEDLNEELKLLMEESEKELPGDLLEGKHKPSENKPNVPSPEKIVVTKPEGEEAEIITIEDPVKEHKIWYLPNYLRFIEKLKTEPSEDADEVASVDSEYVPPAVIFDEDCDYDEFDAEDEIPADELKALEEESSMDLNKAANYIPIWVPVDSVKERVERALEEKKRLEEEAKAKEEELKAAQQKEAEEAKEAKDGEDGKLTLKGVGNEPKPQRKLSARSKREDGKESPKKESKKDSPKKESKKDSPKKESPKKDSKKESPKKDSPGKSPKKSSPGRKDENAGDAVASKSPN